MTSSSGHPWNSDRTVGPREHFTPDEIWNILHQLQISEKWHDLALLCTGIDSLLRCVDLLPLKVRDVTNRRGVVSENIHWRQQKTTRGVAPTLTKTAIKALQKWIEISGKKPKDYLFTRTKASHEKPISDGAFREVIKKWASLIDLDPTPYSTHSLRRTKPHFMYRQGVDIAYISTLLGHKDISSTLVYLGISTEEARYYAQKFDIWDKSFHPKTDKAMIPRKQETLGIRDCDVFLIGQIQNRLDQLTTSNEKLTAAFSELRDENRALTALIKDLLADPSKRHFEKE